MKREIKFRGKRSDNGELVYGDFRPAENCIAVPCYIRHFGIGYDVYPVDPDTVGQYTGIKDARGADIYDGDIIECISSNHIPIRHLIRFCDERGYYAQYDNSNWTGELNECGPICQHYIDKFGKYVIGNIHDNPELLKTEK